MDNTRLLLWATFSLLLWFTYRAWLTDYPPPAVEPPQQVAGNELPEPPANAEGLPQLSAPPSQATPLDTVAAEPSRPIRVQTDVLNVLKASKRKPKNVGIVVMN